MTDVFKEMSGQADRVDALLQRRISALGEYLSMFVCHKLALAASTCASRRTLGFGKSRASVRWIRSYAVTW
jgi:hypothetical protein